MTARVYDSIIIGGGIAGLVSAAALARQGRRVVILEQDRQLGGYCTTFQRRGFTLDAAVHHIGSCGKWGLVRRILRQLEAPAFPCVAVAPFDHLYFPDLSWDFPADLDQLQSKLIAAYPQEARGVREFLRTLLRLYRAMVQDKAPALATWEQATYQQLLDHYLSTPDIKRILGGQWGYWGLPPAQTGAVGAALILGGYWKDGAYYPYQGMAHLAQCLLQVLQQCQGEVRRATPVTGILVTDGPRGARVAGVRLGTGATLQARSLIAAMDVRQLLQLLPAGSLPASYRTQIDQLEVSTAFFSLWLGVDGQLDLGKLKPGFYHLQPGHWLYINIPSRWAPQVAPAGQQLLSILAFWEETTRPASKQQAAEQIQQELQAWLPHLSQHIVMQEAASPATYQRYTGNTQGAAYGWALTPSQSGRQRLAPQTPLQGLYLAGHWTFPGPGIPAVMASGWRAAQLVLQEALAETS